MKNRRREDEAKTRVKIQNSARFSGMTHLSEAFGWISLFVAVVGYGPYVRGMYLGTTRPHAFSWFIWGLLTAIAFFAQKTGGAGPGAWATGLTAIVAFGISAFAIFRGEKQIARSDWGTFLAALSILPIWAMTDDPLLAVWLVTFIDALGFYPTFRKSWHHPHDELVLTYNLSTLKFILALLALQNFSLTTALYPASLVVMNGAFVGMVLWRRRVLRCGVEGR
jgi:hypothetical protein